MKDCRDCTVAAARPHGGFTMGCKGCAARAVARGPNWRRCLERGMQDRGYRSELATMGVTHAEVRAAAQADAMQPKDQA